MQINELEFLYQSNLIESVFDADSLMQAVYAWEYLKAQKVLTIEVILKTHKILMKDQPLADFEKGHFRKIPVYIGGKEALKFGEILDNILIWIESVENTIANPSDKKFRFDHVMYEKIHPFVDGNGRTGRMFMNWARLKVGKEVLVIENIKKYDYYKWFE